MANGTAKQTIVDAVIDRVEAGSMRSVQVAKLIKELGVNRNTFYYHFASKYDVALYAFRIDLAAELSANFPEYELVSAPLANELGSEELPFYVHREIGARTLDLSDFFKALTRCVLGRPAFYGKLFDRSEPEFHSLVCQLYRPAVERDLDFVLGGRYLPPSTFELFCYRYTNLVYEVAEYALKHTGDMQVMLDDAVNPFWNMPHEALVHALQAHPLRRPRQS